MDDKVCTEGDYPIIEYKGKAAGQSSVHDRPITVSGEGQDILELVSSWLVFVASHH